MATKLNAYLSFRDNARQVMEFYQSVFGGQLTMNTFKDFHAAQDQSEENLVMHSMLEMSDGMLLMASDTPSRMEYKPGNNVSLSLSGDDENKLRGYFEKLSDGGEVTMPLEKAIWGDIFGMCTDKFGIQWLVNVATPKETVTSAN
jgi:PhnB protein